MADWESDSPKLQTNLESLLQSIRDKSPQRLKLTFENARQWQIKFMDGLVVPDPKFVGRFRGEPDLENINVYVAFIWGVDAQKVPQELKVFEIKLNQILNALDKQIGQGDAKSPKDIKDVLECCAWAHGEWVRIHPFVNGNGRTARLWANAIALCYDLPPFVRLRPHPDGDYGQASASLMLGNWDGMVPIFHDMLKDALG